MSSFTFCSHPQSSSHRKLNIHLPAESSSGACEGGQGQARISIIKEAIYRGTAGVHALGQFGFRDLLHFHFLGDLPGDHALQGDGGRVLKDCQCGKIEHQGRDS